jgi:Asp-tRNA(Asn)/Glu-tRNA(Gln) amidotransferase A subunit family amidase
MTLCDAPGSYLDAVEENLRMMHNRGSRNILPFHYTGHPALALPVGKPSAGLPVSMQLAGRFVDDPLRMRVAYACQHATDWATIISARG